ncbi:Hypothetical Protein FCC1311_045822 [Hondaea fermentalgiana]|uniref:Uncharacterized protein n=1 Tax=Hondaea fermentalgiana TaxID=2315210 RepID=A0A2R5GDH4_9STRA|nr:Hypothetical Protein FCC1311_045822 [Hondaea fermentalgiana]|eukprot:GBG28359.1 Hypothetical Protein FCC1311_045822 [Hondaea fermentalgiana]
MQALGDNVYDSLRYYEAAAEIVQDTDDPKAAKKFHRIVLLTEAVLFVLDISKQEGKRNIWAGEGAHPPIMLQDVISVNPLPKRSEIFAEDEINKTVRHFEVTYLVKQDRKVVELAAWETGSLLLNQIESAWTSLQMRLCQDIPIEVRLDPDESQSLMHELFTEIAADIMVRQVESPGKVLQSIDELADAALHDRELKRLFFIMPALFHHLVSELQANRLPPRGLARSKTLEPGHGEDRLTQRAGFLAGVSVLRGKVSFPSRTQQLGYIRAILRLLHCMLFNSQTVLDRSNILTPTPLSFVELLQALTIQYDARSVSRALHRLEVARVSAAEEVQRQQGPGERQRRASLDSQCSGASATRHAHRERKWASGDDESDTSSSDDDDDDDDDDVDLDDALASEGETGGLGKAKRSRKTHSLGSNSDETSSSDDNDDDDDNVMKSRLKGSKARGTAYNQNFGHKSKKRGKQGQVKAVDAFDDNFVQEGEGNGKSKGGNGKKRVAGGGGDLLRAISEYQVSILLELDNVVTFAIWQGRSRAVVSETLATQLSKAGSEFTRHALAKIVRRFVELIEQWRCLTGTVGKVKDQTAHKSLGSFAVRIYQHARLLQVLMLGNYRVLRHILENSEEELRYYLFKPSFYSSLTDVPSAAAHFKQIVVLNRISKAIVEDMRSAIDSLEMQKKRAVQEHSVLLI